MNDPVPDRVCDQCGCWIERNKLLYRLRVEIVAEPGPPELGDEDIQDPAKELESLVERMSAMSEEQAREAMDQVWERFDFNLCGPCRAEVRARLKLRKPW